jgi:hypothetical protein
MKFLAATLLSIAAAHFGPENTREAVAESVYASQDVALETDPNSSFWKNSTPFLLEKDKYGNDVPGYHTTVFSRWTANYLYFFFVCPCQELHLKPNPSTAAETYELWNWDVAEVFIGSDFANIKRYKEFEVSPQGEWVDLDVDLNKPHHEDGWVWNSGFQMTARIDEGRKIWYAAMKIPFASIDSRTAAPGNTFRANFFLSEGPPSNHKHIVWQPTMSETFHVPGCFGLLKLVAR